MVTFSGGPRHHRRRATRSALFGSEFYLNSDDLDEGVERLVGLQPQLAVHGHQVVLLRLQTNNLATQSFELCGLNLESRCQVRGHRGHSAQGVSQPTVNSLRLSLFLSPPPASSSGPGFGGSGSPCGPAPPPDGSPGSFALLAAFRATQKDPQISPSLSGWSDVRPLGQTRDGERRQQSIGHL